MSCQWNFQLEKFPAADDRQLILTLSAQQENIQTFLPTELTTVVSDHLETFNNKNFVFSTESIKY